MIDLFTGNPGHGKSLKAVSNLAELIKQWSKDASAEREVWVWGIKGLALPHKAIEAWPLAGKRGDPIPVDSRGRPTCALAMDWGDIPDGSLVIFDEAQYFFPMRGPSVQQPVHSKFLNTHRQAGFDVWLITQHPKNLDNAVRRLVDKHMHIRRVFGWRRAQVYEWPYCEDGLQGLKSAVMTSWSYPKKSFELYKSAEIHTKQTFEKPWWIWVPVLLIPAAVWAVPHAWDGLSKTFGGKSLSDKPKAPASAPAPTAPAPMPMLSAPALPPALPASAASAAASSDPVVKYAGCAAMRGVCRCYLGDATPAEKPAEFCEATVGAHLPAKLVEIPPSLLEYTPPPQHDRAHDYIVLTPPKSDNTISLADVVARYR